MLFLLLVLVLSAAALTVLLWVITLFFQGYFYTEATVQIQWQAPAALSTQSGKIRITAYDGAGNSAVAASPGRFQVWGFFALQ